MCAHALTGCYFKFCECLTQNTIDLVDVEVRKIDFKKASTVTNRIGRLCCCQTPLGSLNLVANICVDLQVTKAINAIRSPWCSGNGIR